MRQDKKDRGQHTVVLQICWHCAANKLPWLILAATMLDLAAILFVLTPLSYYYYYVFIWGKCGAQTMVKKLHSLPLKYRLSLIRVRQP